MPLNKIDLITRLPDTEKPDASHDGIRLLWQSCLTTLFWYEVMIESTNPVSTIWKNSRQVIRIIDLC